MTFSGNYPIQHRVGEIERLNVQSTAMVPDTVAMLERFGSMTGWVCLDIGCGPGGITDLISASVGATGRVIGLDMNAQFLDHARKKAPSNVEFRVGDAYQSDLPAGAFDLVHVRFVASTAGNPQQLLKEAKRLARPGGIIALQEPDGSTLACYPPHPAWDRLLAAYMAAFKGVGSDLTLARRLYFVVHEAGLHNVQYRTSMLSVRSIDPMVDYLPSMIESLRATILRLGLLNEDDLVAALAECRQHLAKPGTAFTMWTLAQVWGWTTCSYQPGQ
ncbi:MAG TPA: methyltransferase domain-containing protein [Candidatus Binataceae bacterium]